MRTLTITLLGLATLGLAVAGCLDDENYTYCKFAVDFNDECNVQEDDDEGETAQGINCVLTQHPQCDDGICIRYHGSSPYCSIACLIHDDCPGNGICEEFAKGCDENSENCNQYCVKLIPCRTDDDCDDNDNDNDDNDGTCREFDKGCDKNGENCNHYCVKG